MNAVHVAQSILDYPDEAVLQVLSLAPGLPPVTAETPITEARRNYMRLAMLVHPDKIKDSFERSTEAFQKLVRAFELLADPKYRKKLLSRQVKKEQTKKGSRPLEKAKQVGRKQQKQETKQLITLKEETKLTADVSPSKPKRTRTAVRKRVKKEKHTAAYDFIDDEEEEEEEEEEENDDDDEEGEGEGEEEFDFADAEPVVSTNRTLLGTRRTGGVYRDTAVSCPQCRTLWIPDSKQHYTLFMGPAGKKVHCETCLCRFGCATAVHACPHCQHSFDYDVSMYDDVITCDGCRKTFGFSYYPVNQHLIDQVKLDEWRERTEREKAREREERANRRRHVDNDTLDKFHSLVGTCIVDEMCPLCRRTVTSQHRKHVEMCQKTNSTKSSATTKVVTKKPTRTKTSAPVKSKTKRPAPKKAKKRRRGESDSEEEDSFTGSSEDDD